MTTFTTLISSIINPARDDGWEDFVTHQTGNSVFHSAAWAKTLSQTYGYKPCYVVLRNRENKIAAGLPLMDVHSILTGRRGISLPFTDACPSLHQTNDQFQQLLGAAIRIGKELHWKYLELRLPEERIPNAPSAQFIEHRLELDKGIDVLHSNLRGSVRRAIKKAEKQGITLEADRSLDAIRAFYKLNCQTRKHHGLPPQPFSFFRHLHQNVFITGKGLVFMARHQDRVIAASLFLHTGQRAVYKYGASDRHGLPLRANNAVMWKAIQWYAEHGYESLSMGKTRQTNIGLLQFKRGWGCMESSIHYFRYDFDQDNFVQPKDHVTGLHNLVFRGLPIPLARIVGALIYRHAA